MCVIQCFHRRNAYENVNCFAWGNLINLHKKAEYEKQKREEKKKLWYNLFLNIGNEIKKNV